MCQFTQQIYTHIQLAALFCAKFKQSSPMAGLQTPPQDWPRSDLSHAVA